MSSQRERLRPAPMSISPLTVVAGVVDLHSGPRPYAMSDGDRDRFLASVEASGHDRGITRPSGDPAAPKRLPSGRGEAAGWSGRQQAAARELEHLWRAAMPIRGLPKGYGNLLAGSGRDVGPEEAEIAQQAWDRYCEAMEEVARRCSPRHANALRLVVIYSEPSTLDRAYLVREALSFLGDYWRLK